MIELQASYAVADFVPFSAEVYFRLLERVGESLWPLHLLALASGGVLLYLALLGRMRTVAALLALCWIWVGVNFFIRHYAQLNWAGAYIGWAFLLQAGLLLLLALIGGRATPPALRSIPAITGTLLVVLALAVYPLLAPLLGFGWYQAETFAIHADPTALATLGLLLLMLRGLWLWLLALVPLLWCQLSGMTLQVLEAPWAVALYLAAGATLLAMLWAACAARPADRSA